MKHHIYYQPMPGGPLAHIFGVFGTATEPKTPTDLQACRLLGDKEQAIAFDSFNAAVKYLEDQDVEKLTEGNYWILPATPHLAVRQKMTWEKKVTV